MERKFYTQYDERPVGVQTFMMGSMTVDTPVVTNSQRIHRMFLTGALVDAYNKGYDYLHDEELPDVLTVVPGRGADITDTMDYILQLKGRVDEAIIARRKAVEEVDGRGAGKDAQSPGDSVVAITPEQRPDT